MERLPIPVPVEFDADTAATLADVAERTGRYFIVPRAGRYWFTQTTCMADGTTDTLEWTETLTDEEASTRLGPGRFAHYVQKGKILEAVVEGTTL